MSSSNVGAYAIGRTATIRTSHAIETITAGRFKTKIPTHGKERKYAQNYSTKTDNIQRKIGDGEEKNARKNKKHKSNSSFLVNKLTFRKNAARRINYTRRVPWPGKRSRRQDNWRRTGGYDVIDKAGVTQHRNRFQSTSGVFLGRERKRLISYTNAR